jgi:transcriptional repressor NrdR
VRCPFCTSDDDRVVDSRLAEDGGAIRRRRECVACGQRFTTFERVEEVPLVVVKRSGVTEPFDRAKLIRGLQSACKNRPVTDEMLDELCDAVEESLRLHPEDVSSEEIGRAVLERLREVDEVGYVRFASVYKGFEELSDFEREVGMLIKTTAPKARG